MTIGATGGTNPSNPIQKLLTQVRQHEKELYFGACAVSIVASAGMGPLKTFFGAMGGVAATQYQFQQRRPVQDISCKATREDALRHAIPTLVSAALRPSRLFLPVLVGVTFGNMLVRQTYNK